MKKVQLLAVLFLSLFAISGLHAQQEQPYQQQQEQQQEQQETKVYTADLSSLNGEFIGQEVTGTLTITVEGDQAMIQLMVTGLAPDMEHMAHLHGFEDGSAASCPDMMADANNDSIVDLMETEEAAGVTMIPFHDDPINLEIGAEGYPQSDGMGTITYSQEISLQELKDAMQSNFNIQEFDFSNYVVFIHGVGDDVQLPETVESLPDAPASATVPVACGKLEEQNF